MRAGTLLAIFILSSFGLFAQDPCLFPGNNKEVEELETLVESKAGKEIKIEALTEKVNEYAGNGRLWFEIGRFQFLQAETDEIPDYTNALKSLLNAAKSCPSVNPLLDYYLGIIYYTNADYKNSLKFFKRFLLNSENPSDKDHSKKLEDVRASISVIEKEQREAQRTFTDAERVDSKLLNKVSTEKSEYLPSLSPDNSMLFFTRKFFEKSRGDEFEREIERFSVANRTGELFEFDEGKALQYPFNMGGNYGGATISVNNKEMFITVCIQLENGYKNCDIFETHYEQYRPDPKDSVKAWRWTDLKNLGPAINSESSWEAQPSISPDGKSLYFTRYSDNTKETDLYHSERDATGKWMEAIPFPESVNTTGNDKAPFMHQDGKTLYFSSSGRPGEGGFDIYMTVKEDSVHWRRPINIGLPINTIGDEHGLVVSTDGKYAVYASNGSQHGEAPYDVFYVEMPPKGRPEEIVFIKGKVEDAVPETHLQLKSMDGKVIREIELDKADGTYAAILKKAEIKSPLILGIEQDGVAFEARIIDTNRVIGGTIDNESMRASKITPNKPYTIRDINFESNSSVVRKESFLMLDEFSNFLKKNPTYRATIQGHTDNSGDAASNLQLSVERALSVKTYLINKGIPASRLDHKGFGDTQPLQENQSVAGRAKNRRTEFVLQ